MLNTVLRDGMINGIYCNSPTQKHKMKPAELNSRGILKKFRGKQSQVDMCNSLLCVSDIVS